MNQDALRALVTSLGFMVESGLRATNWPTTAEGVLERSRIYLLAITEACGTDVPIEAITETGRAYFSGAAGDGTWFPSAADFAQEVKRRMGRLTVILPAGYDAEGRAVLVRVHRSASADEKRRAIESARRENQLLDVLPQPRRREVDRAG